jgi:hypothetical protein
MQTASNARATFTLHISLQKIRIGENRQHILNRQEAASANTALWD